MAAIGGEERRRELGERICGLLWEGEREAALAVIESLAEEEASPPQEIEEFL